MIGRLLLIAFVAFLFYGLQPALFPGDPSATFRVVSREDAPTLVKYLDMFDEQLGDDRTAYENHCLRTLSFAEEFLRGDGLSEEDIQSKRKIMETTLAFHDIALWSDGELDYLEPSAAQADKVVKDLSKEDMQLVRDIIIYHHKFTAFSGGADDAVVNAVRKVVQYRGMPSYHRHHFYLFVRGRIADVRFHALLHVPRTNVPKQRREQRREHPSGA